MSAVKDKTPTLTSALRFIYGDLRRVPVEPISSGPGRCGAQQVC